MTRNDDVEEQPADRPGQLPLDPRLQRAFEDAFAGGLPLDVAARHLWRIDRHGRPVIAGASRTGRWRRAARNACVGAVALCFPGLLGQASLGALPGDLLYPAKRQYEDVQIRTAVSWTTRDAVLLAHARRRLLEARAIADTRPRHLLNVVADADAAIHELQQSPDAGAPEVNAFRAEAARTIAELSTVVDDDTRRQLHTAMEGMEGFGRDRRPPRALAFAPAERGDTRSPAGATSEVDLSETLTPPTFDPRTLTGPTRTETADETGSTPDPVAQPEPSAVRPTPIPAEPAPGPRTQLTPSASAHPSEPLHPVIRPTSPAPPATAEQLENRHDCGDQLAPPPPRRTASAVPSAADEAPGDTIPSSTAQVTPPPADVNNGCGTGDGDPVVADHRTDPPLPADAADVPTTAAPAPFADRPGGVPEAVSTDGADE